MTFKNLFIEHERSQAVEDWIKEEIQDQEERYGIIAKQMDDLKPKREKWYQEFFDRISTRGFNVDNDQKEVITPDRLPVKPEDREDKVLWKYGIDGE